MNKNLQKKVTLTYYLPQEKLDFELAYKGADYRYAIEDIVEYLREIIKYEKMPIMDGKEIKTEKEKDILIKFAGHFRAHIYNEIKERGLEL